MRKQLHQLNLEFKEGILILASSLSAGYSIENAFAVSTKELQILYGGQGLIIAEFNAMVHQMKMNHTVEQVLSDFAMRSNLDDVRNFTQVFIAAKRNGGDMVSIINHTASIIQDKVQVQEEIITMTTSKQFEQKIMNLLPFFLIFYIDITSPGFFDLMYTTNLGRIIMTVCLGVYLTALVIAKQILLIKI